MIDVDQLKSKKTNGINYGVETDDVIKKLQQWDDQFGIEISDIAHDAVTVSFKSIPDDTRSLAEEIYEFCPDTIDQHFGCFEELIDGAEPFVDPKPFRAKRFAAI